ncbi:putative toxin-antitoxin system toxin component, PIN family [bacterium]|nr:putative toxin-antitoxin system toxin component, PIN family [bacterium]
MIVTENKIKIVVDTNVFISAFVFGGKPLEIIQLFLKDKVELYISPFIINELARILEEKFSWEEDKIKKILEILELKAIKVYPKTKVSLIKEKKDDNCILECALEGKVDYIISGDRKHILPLKEFKGIKIVSVGEFLEIYDIHY